MADNDEISAFHSLHARNTMTLIPNFASMAEASFINFAIGQTQAQRLHEEALPSSKLSGKAESDR